LALFAKWFYAGTLVFSSIALVWFLRRRNRIWMAAMFVDGKPAELLRVDYLCMGAAVPPGEHVVEFRCIDGTLQAGFMLGVFLLFIVTATWLLRPAKKQHA